MANMVLRSRKLKQFPSKSKREMTLQWERIICLPLPTLTPFTQVPFMERSVITALSSPSFFSISKCRLEIPTYFSFLKLIPILSKRSSSMNSVQRDGSLPTVKEEDRSYILTGSVMVTNQPHVSLDILISAPTSNVLNVKN